MGKGNEKKKTESAARACGSEEATSFHKELAADANGAEAENDVPAGSRPAKAHHGTEAGEKKHLVNLMAQIGTVGSGKNLIIGHLAMSVDGDVDHKAMGQRKFKFVLLGRPGLRVVRER